MASGIETAQKGPSKFWYIVPILFEIIGGIIMYFALRHRDQKMANKGLIVGVLMFVGQIVLGAAIIFFAPALLLDGGTGSAQSLALSNVHLWTSSDGRSSAAGLVVTNVGSETIFIDSIKIRGLSVPYSSWYYNKADVTFANILTPLKADFTPSFVNIDSDAAEEAFVQATQPVALEPGSSAIIYISNPAYIQGIDNGLAFAVQVNANTASDATTATVMPAG